MSNEQLAGIFKALGDPTRLKIFETLRCCAVEVEVDESGQCRPARSLSVGEVCCRFGGSMSTISHHLKELRLAGLIRMEKRGRWIYCSVNPDSLELIQRWVQSDRTDCVPETAPENAEEGETVGCC